MECENLESQKLLNEHEQEFDAGYHYYNSEEDKDNDGDI